MNLVSLLPSEIARLILNYLESEELIKTYEIFLEECKHLEEAKIYIKKGFVVPNTIHGKTLEEYLVINRKDLEENTKSFNSTGTQTDLIKSPIKTKSEHSLISQTANAETQTNENHFMNNDESVVEIENDTDKPCRPQNKKRSLLIGKNVEKQPDISYSTLEPVRSQLNSIIADATQQMKIQDELEQLKCVASSIELNKSDENITNILPCPSGGEILTVNGNLMNGIILTMNRNVTNKNTMSTNTAPLNIITPACNNMTNMVTANNNLINLGNSHINGQPIFLTDLMSGSSLNFNNNNINTNNGIFLNLLKNNINTNNISNKNSLPVILASNSNSNVSNILSKPSVSNTLTKISPCPAGYLRNALSSLDTQQSPSNKNKKNNDNVNRRTNKKNICNLIPITGKNMTATLTANPPTANPPIKSNESTDDESQSKKRRNTIKNIFDQSQNPVGKKFRNSRIVTIDPPDPATLLKLNELASMEAASSKKDVHDEISDMFNLTNNDQKEDKLNFNRSNSNLEELIKKNLSPTNKKSNKLEQIDSNNSTLVVSNIFKQEPKDYSDQEESEIDEMTTSANDDDSDDSDYELVLQLNRESKNLTPSKNSSIVNTGSIILNGKNKKLNDQVKMGNNSNGNRSLRPRMSLNRK